MYWQKVKEKYPKAYQVGQDLWMAHKVAGVCKDCLKVKKCDMKSEKEKVVIRCPFKET
jgi:hypothetical protein